MNKLWVCSLPGSCGQWIRNILGLTIQLLFANCFCVFDCSIGFSLTELFTLSSTPLRLGAEAGVLMWRYSSSIDSDILIKSYQIFALWSLWPVFFHFWRIAFPVFNSGAVIASLAVNQFVQFLIFFSVLSKLESLSMSPNVIHEIIMEL